MTVRKPEPGEIVFEEDCVIIQAETLMKWTANKISTYELRAAIARREGKTWQENQQTHS